MTIDLASPGAAYAAARAEIDAAIARVLSSGQYVLGAEVAAFEKELADWVGVGHAVGVASGTDALELALRGCEIGAGDFVIASAHGPVAVVAAIERAGAIPVLVDVHPRTLLIEPQAIDTAARQIAGRRAGRRAAVVIVHLYGCPADLTPILEVAGRHDLVAIEDCAQAPGAMYGPRRVGTFGAAAAFSFYPTKNIAAAGDAGAVVTHDRLVAERVRMLREYGARTRQVAEVRGVNSRLDELQAAILRVSLRHASAANEARRRIAAEYDRRLAGTSLELPPRPASREQVFHLYVVSTNRRESLRRHLTARGIATGVHYPVPVHRQPAYAGHIELGGTLAVTERAASTVLSLPMYPQLAAADVAAVCDAIVEWDASR